MKRAYLEQFKDYLFEGMDTEARECNRDAMEATDWYDFYDALRLGWTQSDLRHTFRDLHRQGKHQLASVAESALDSSDLESTFEVG